MNRFTATNTKPVTQNEMVMVSSIDPQLEASGVSYHGLRKWNSTVPTTRTIRAIAMALQHAPADRFGTERGRVAQPERPPGKAGGRAPRAAAAAPTQGNSGAASAARATGVRDDGLARPVGRFNAFMQLSPGAHAAGM